MFMSTKNNSHGLDFVTPVMEIVQAMLIMTAQVLFMSIKYFWRKLIPQKEKLQKIDRTQLSVAKTTTRSSALGIDTRTKEPVYLFDFDFRRHSFIVGAAGFGKTNLITILQEHALKSNKPVIFIDPKGDLGALNSFKKLCEKWGRTCHVFSEHHKESISLNPLRDGSVTQICEKIMNSFEWTEPHYRTCSSQALYKVVSKIKKEEKNVTLERIYYELREILDKDNSGIYNKLEGIMHSDFAPVLSSDEAKTFKEIRDERACLYVGLSALGYPEIAKTLGKFFLGDLFLNAYDALKSNEGNEALRNPISVFIDEFGALVTPEFLELQNKCRGAGIELTMAVQTASDIDRICPALTSQIIENAGNIFVLKQRLDSAASLFADAIGTVLTKKKTYRFEGDSRSEMGSERESHELIVHPDVIKNLRIGQCVALRHSPTKVNLVNIRNGETIQFKPKPQVTAQKKRSKAFE
jgi:conjugal transfer pilus assembly protein TraD